MTTTPLHQYSPTNSASASVAPLPVPSEIRVLTLNCWGLKYISTYRAQRLTEIGRQLTLLDPSPHVVCLQECWTQADYLSIKRQTAQILPHTKFYHSGIFGGGLAIFSAFPVVGSSMYRYPLNGRPTAFFRGDWFVGKGVACATLKLGPNQGDLMEVLNTHLHAPYEREPNDSYICHRTAQAWEIAKLARAARDRGRLVLAVGDFNMVPSSLAHELVQGMSGLRDTWRIVKPDSSIGPYNAREEQARGFPVPNAEINLKENGTTCDSLANTWRMPEEVKKRILKGHDVAVDWRAEDRRAKRLDYVFFSNSHGQGDAREWSVKDARLGMTMRHPELKCSLSDHFSVEVTLGLSTGVSDPSAPSGAPAVPVKSYDLILAMIDKYHARELRQRRLRLLHFGASIGVSIACHVAQWWSPRPFVSFLLTLLSTLGLVAGVLDGMVGGLFVGSELRALWEFQWEVKAAREAALSSQHDVEVGR